MLLPVVGGLCPLVRAILVTILLQRPLKLRASLSAGLTHFLQLYSLHYMLQPGNLGAWSM